MPLPVPPRPMVMSRRERSFMSITRFQAMVRGSMPRLCACGLEVVVDERGEQVVGLLDGAEVAGEVQVDVLHGHHLRVAATGRAALHAEHRTERWVRAAPPWLFLPSLFSLREADAGGGLAFAGGRGAHGGDQDQLALRHLLLIDEVEGELGLGAAVGLDALRVDAELLADGGRWASVALSARSRGRKGMP
jgi:hypothetical protein